MISKITRGSFIHDMAVFDFHISICHETIQNFNLIIFSKEMNENMLILNWQYSKQKFKYLVSILTENRKCDVEI